MFTLKSAAILALIGSAFAAPLAHRATDDTPEFGRYTKKVVQVVPASDDSQETKVVYVVGTPSGSDDDSTTQVTTHHRHGSGTTSSGTTDTSSSSDTGSTDSASTDTSSTGSTDTTASTGSSTGYMAIVSKYRTAGGLAALTQSSKLEANALKTAQDGKGQMVHELNPGTFGQVLAPGTASNFESVYVGGWLCEKPSLKGLNGICTTMTKGWSHDGETGHADILTDPKYKSIGCALADGIWACDVA